MYFEIIEIGVPTNKHHQKERMKKLRVSDSMDKLTEVFVTKENILLPFIFFINGFLSFSTVLKVLN